MFEVLPRNLQANESDIKQSNIRYGNIARRRPQGELIMIKKIGEKWFVFVNDQKVSDGFDDKGEAQARDSAVEAIKNNGHKRVNVRSTLVCNEHTVTEKVFEGVNHKVIKGAKHMRGDTVMNDIFYSSDEMNKLADSLVEMPTRESTSDSSGLGRCS